MSDRLCKAGPPQYLSVFFVLLKTKSTHINCKAFRYNSKQEGMMPCRKTSGEITKYLLFDLKCIWKSHILIHMHELQAKTAFVCVLFFLTITGRDRKSRSSLDRCAAVFRGSNKCVCVFMCESVSMCKVWREGEQLFWNSSDGNGAEPKEDADMLSAHRHTPPKPFYENTVKLWSYFMLLTHLLFSSWEQYKKGCSFEVSCKFTYDALQLHTHTHKSQDLPLFPLYPNTYKWASAFVQPRK